MDMSIKNRMKERTSKIKEEKKKNEDLPFLKSESNKEVKEETKEDDTK